MIMQRIFTYKEKIGKMTFYSDNPDYDPIEVHEGTSFIMDPILKWHIV